MGGGKYRTQRKHFRHNRENVWKRNKSDSQPENNDNNATIRKPSWDPIPTQSLPFEEYYKEQGIVSSEEWETFIEILRRPLPAAFRINSSSQFSSDIRSKLEDDFMKCLQAEGYDGTEVEGILPLPWYPDNLAWHSNFSRAQIRKNKTLERFHEFLKLENEVGNVTRQEAVSMVPPLLLDVHPDHFVLDMCAAPGSKTFQLLETLHQSTQPGSFPTGMVIANDLDVQRCNLLIHQTKRMCTANLIVTNHEAQQFPSCRLAKNHANASGNEVGTVPNLTQILFDRVLCDVPCSGDGTLRKAPDIWRKWNTGNGNGLHSLQIQIAMRGVSLLKVGGRMVYSTCSMNPVENEAVVAEILRRCGGSIELLDVSKELPQLVRRPGLKKWKIKDKGIWLASHKEVSKFRQGSILPSMFHSSGHDESSVGEENVNNDEKSFENGAELANNLEASTNSMNEEVSSFPLERCMRIVPHDQNTGAFFIAVFHKISQLPASSPNHPDKLQDIPDSNTDSVNVTEENSNGCELNSENVTEEIVEIPSDVDMDDVDTKVDEAKLDINPTTQVKEEIQVETAVLDKESAPKLVTGKRKLQIQGKWRGVDPVVFFTKPDVVDTIKTFYGISDAFPFKGHLISRNIDFNSVKRVYYVSSWVKDILELNFKAGQQLKIASVGLKMFERQSSTEGSLSQCSFRIASEGLPFLLPYITKQILYASPIDFKHLLQYKTIKFGDFVDANFGKAASELLMGCCVIVLGKGSNDSSSEPLPAELSTIAIGCWRGRTNIAVMVTAIDCLELLERLSARKEFGNVFLSTTDNNNNKTDSSPKEEDEEDNTCETPSADVVVE
ncbi:RNA cytosine-C(5)-methyltransferase NSUN2 [Impatiens glandulifera]|uniref:RNA cytosine-C(5)-methyltransferase NSUN2 n=1 Tax=Impatiens glandulifera TaxID=253017 RepID=UPI001FB122AE|nr:RNA cytosine-C(5)-methyltransferase NSUN2 [Impatiens glandulifera]